MYKFLQKSGKGFTFKMLQELCPLIVHNHFICITLHHQLVTYYSMTTKKGLK